MNDLCQAPLIHLGSSVAQRVIEHACDCLPEEACGVLLGERTETVWRVERTVRSRNVATGDRRRGYAVESEVVMRCTLAARRGGDAVLGFYHSHPTGAALPSARDEIEAWPDKVYLIVPLDTGCGGIPRCWWTPQLGAPFCECRLASDDPSS